MAINDPAWWKRTLPLILCLLLSAFFINAQQPSQVPSKDLMVASRAIRVDRTLDPLPTRHPVIQIEVYSEELFDGRNQIHALRIGSHEFISYRTLPGGAVFELTPREFAKTKTGDEVVVRYGATNPIKKRLLRDWPFGRLDKAEVDQRPVKTFEGTSIGESVVWSKNGNPLPAEREIKVRSRTLDPRTKISIMTVTEDNMFPQQWLAAPIGAHATSLSKRQMRRTLQALNYAMSKYPVLFLRDNIKRIFLLGSLTLYGLSGDATHSSDSIYIVNSGEEEYTDEYLDLTFHRAFANLILQKNNRARDPGAPDVVRFAPQKSAVEKPSADHLMKLVYEANEGSPEYIYALENTGFIGVTLFKQFKHSPRDDAIRCQLRCREIRQPTSAALRETIKEHNFVYHREIVDVAPVWSHDGKQIAFQSTRDHDVAELYVMRVDGSNIRRLTHTAYSPSQTTGYSAAVWSPDDRQLAYVMHPRGPSQLFTVKADGTGQRRLDNGTNNGIFLIGWLPDRRILILTEGRDSSRSVYSILPDDTGLTRLTETDIVVGQAHLAPDQNLIAIATASNLIIKDLKFNTPSQSISSSGFSSEVSWSPDSKQIAYQNHGSLIVRDLKSNTIRSSSIDSNERIFGMSWSPDGKQIAYVGARGLGRNSPSVNELRVANADGSGGRRLTAEGFAPVWSPDGKYIIFSRLQARLYLIRADGSGERYLTSGAYAKWVP